MCRNPSTAQIAAFLAEVPTPQRKVVAALRRLVRQTAPDTAETIF
jgi:hypothetical protein